MTRTYAKPALTYQQQIAHLRASGMVIADEAQAEYWLRHVSYYRLSAYWLYFEHPKRSGGIRFKPDTTFEAVTALYDFDRILRRLTMRGTEHVEVALRGSWAYQMGGLGNGHSYVDASLYTSRPDFHENLAKLTAETGRSRETYIKHYRSAYDSPPLPPAWMVAEMMSFGQLSRWYSNLADRALRNKIAEPLGLPETVLVPLIGHVTDLRNICAHHGMALESTVPETTQTSFKAQRSRRFSESKIKSGSSQTLQRIDDDWPCREDRVPGFELGIRYSKSHRNSSNR